jgi:hypothetical protein
MTADSLARLVDWYAENCNGEWEHQYGVHLETMDNPGWHLRVDLTETEHQDRRLARIRRGNSAVDASWSECWVEEMQFRAFCGPRGLAEVIDFFMRWIDKL